MLPRIEHPAFDLEIPSTKKKTKIRPMLVKEEKILLMAKESGLPSDIFEAILQILRNCILDDKFNVNDLTLFDLEYAFLKLRAISVSNVVDVTYIDREDGKEYPFKIDLAKVTVKFPENTNMTIKISDTEGFVMRYPRASIYSSETFKNSNLSEADLIEELLIGSIEQYFKDDKVYKMAEHTRMEIKEFVDNIDINTFNKIREFVSNLPSLNYDIKYTNSKGNEKTITLTTLSDFFTLL